MTSPIATEQPGFSAATVAELARLRDEPAWLRERRQSAWRIYEALPLPDRREEEWRRVDIRALDLAAQRAFSKEGRQAAPLLELSQDGLPRAGTLLQHNSTSVGASLAPELAAKGVILCSLEEAARRYPELVQEHLGEAIKPQEAKFTALASALWSGGAFVYVPKDVEVALPLHGYAYLDEPGLASFWRTIIVADRGSKVFYGDHWRSPALGGQGLSAGLAEVYVKDGAQVTYVTIQDWGRQTFHFATHRAVLERDARFSSLTVGLGGILSKANVEAVQRGPGSHAELLGLCYADGRQFFDHHTLQDHGASHTTSQLLFKTALEGRSRSLFYGLIRVREGAQQTDSFQTSRNLLLSERAKADAIPVLEIEANDVKCSHAAAVGPVDEDQLFYLMSRGLPEADARRMIVGGFFAELIDKLPSEELREKLGRAVEAKMQAAAARV
ncbi:MAG: Fe-S cluster assembly protein SufD [Chloroflexi bacterium]|nr:Fe-S cluster assembly protein SufD [Chloroflexota bacterium]